MIEFNVLYLTKQNKVDLKLKALKGYHDANVQNMVSLINMLQQKNKQYCLANSLVRISVARRAKVERLQCIEKFISRILEDSFIKIKRYTVLSDKSFQIKPENKLNYPVAIINRVYNNNRLFKLEIAWAKIMKAKRFMDLIENRITILEDICEEYQRRIQQRQLFSIFSRVLNKQNDYLNNSLNFEKIYEILRVKKLFIGFSQILLKTEMKTIAQLDKDKSSKKDESVKSNAKRIEMVNELKRKTNNMKGLVNEQIMRNNKKRTDGSKQNGVKLMKKNQQFRGYEMGLAQVVIDIQKLQKEIQRKDNFIKSRPKVAIPFEYLRSIYTQINEKEKSEISKTQIDGKIAKGQLDVFVNGSNYTTSSNAKFKYLVNIYEQIESSRKSDNYLNLDNENSCLKGLISSLIRMQFFQPKREKIIKNVDEINSNLENLKLQMSQLRVQKQQIRKK